MQVTWTPERIDDLREKLEKYIDDNVIPIAAEFAYLHNVNRQSLYEYLPDTIKKLSEKKQANLEKGMLSNKINVTGAIFSLKQLGWRDRFESEMNIKYKLDEAEENI